MTLCGGPAGGMVQNTKATHTGGRESKFINQIFFLRGEDKGTESDVQSLLKVRGIVVNKQPINKQKYREK